MSTPVLLGPGETMEPGGEIETGYLCLGPRWKWLGILETTEPRCAPLGLMEDLWEGMPPLSAGWQIRSKKRTCQVQVEVDAGVYEHLWVSVRLLMGNPACVCVHVCVREKQRERQDTERWLMGAGEESGSRCVRLCCCKNSHPCEGNHGTISSWSLLILNALPVLQCRCDQHHGQRHEHIKWVVRKKPEPRLSPPSFPTWVTAPLSSETFRHLCVRSLGWGEERWAGPLRTKIVQFRVKGHKHLAASGTQLSTLRKEQQQLNNPSP